MTQHDYVDIGTTSLLFVWPSLWQIAKATDVNVLGASVGELNDYSLVVDLHYGTFDVLMTGDADRHVEPQYIGMKLADDGIEVLKVPHHGSKTGMTEAFVDWVKPELAVSRREK
jgi:beta-lactamase superfamily II metal-dependent hydrolase